MATAGAVPRGRTEIFRPGGDSEFDDRSVLTRLIDRMRPDEGFVSIPLVLVLAGAMGWSIADGRWVLGRDELTGFLIWIALAATLWGYVSARLGMPPWLAHSLGSILGAFVVIEVVGSVISGSTPTLSGWLQATTNSVTQAYLDLTWRHQITTLQYGHYSLVLGIIVWGTAQAASYDVFGYHRAVNGVLLLAVVFIASMSLTLNDQFPALVLFSAAGLSLLLLSHAADERSNWLRHRIWRGRDLRSPNLQGGLAFAGLAVCGAFVLTMVASSAPLASPLRDAGQNIADSLSGMSGFFPRGGAGRYQPSSDFGSTSTISSSFSANPNPVFTIRVSTGPVSFHWRLVAYDTFQTLGWSVSSSRQDQVIAGATVNQGTVDLVDATTLGRSQVSLTVHILDNSLKHVVVANEPDSINVDTQRTVIGVGSPSMDVSSLATGATDYVVSALVPNIDPTGDGLTEWILQHAGKDYPDGLLDRFTQGADLVGGDGKALLAQISAWAKSQGNNFDNEYDVAKAMQAYLSSDRFTYSTNITNEMARCTGISTVDCFAVIKRGFCEQYATTMTMLMRMAGYPARYVLGYLPGPPAANTFIEQVTSQQKHAWVEVYFPKYGWIPFDPTGGSIGQPTVLPPGSAVAATPSPNASSGSEPTDPRPSRGTGVVDQGVAPSSGNGGLAGLLIPGSLGAVVAVGLLLLWTRRPRRLERPDTVYQNVVKLASRLGYKPKPTQTVYEYTGMLSEIVPK
ncbi:MAG: transglutaminase-like domain-containing protein, partial [Candidatus Limnocylindrales bacterium]